MTEPTTEAGRRLVASYPGNAAEAASPEFIRHMVRAILAIEDEARRGFDYDGYPIDSGPLTVPEDRAERQP